VTAALHARILLADDHAMVRRGLRHELAGEPDLTVVAEAGDGAEAVRLARTTAVDLAILDVSMPRVTGRRAGAPARRRCAPRRRSGPASPATSTTRSTSR
jgi:DNA-binding NarL/FixJ family response regulator